MFLQTVDWYLCGTRLAVLGLEDVLCHKPRPLFYKGPVQQSIVAFVAFFRYFGGNNISSRYQLSCGICDCPWIYAIPIPSMAWETLMFQKSWIPEPEPLDKIFECFSWCSSSAFQSHGFRRIHIVSSDSYGWTWKMNLKKSWRKTNCWSTLKYLGRCMKNK